MRSAGVVLEPEQVADVVAEAIADERFLILPHPEVHEYMRRKADDPERWLAGMRKLQARVLGGAWDAEPRFRRRGTVGTDDRNRRSTDRPVARLSAH